MGVLYFLIGFSVGSFIGALIYRNNAKKFQRMAHEAISKKNQALIELEQLRHKLGR